MKKEKGERGNFKREIGELKKELKSREATAITQILKSADVVLSTNTGEWRETNSSASPQHCKAVTGTCLCL